MSNARKGLGATGEDLAADALQAAGLTILDRNWSCPTGEIDIVAQESAPDFSTSGEIVPWMVLVEVRTRRGDRFGTALQSVTPRKQAKLRQVSEHYIKAIDWPGPWRIDVVGVQMDSSGKLLAVDHIRHAVGGA